MTTNKPKVLIAYSNPGDSSRLRLDKEHRAIDQVIQKLHLNNQLVFRLHATTVNDLVDAIRNEEYEIIQFSGHGSESGFYIETSDSKSHGQYLTPQKVVDILSVAATKTKAVIFLSCYSASSIPILIDSAPFIITVTGEALDESAITFISAFYEEYFSSNSIERAFQVGLMYSNVKDQQINIVLTRRAMEKTKGKTLLQVYPQSEKFDSILIDLTEVDSDIERIGVSRDKFLSILNRKIRMHEWIFDTPRENALIQFGEYFGVFSWKNANDVLTCHRIMKVKPEIDEGVYELWGKIVLIYNELHLLKYRTEIHEEGFIPNMLIKQAIHSYQMTYVSIFEEKENSDLLRQTIPNQFKVTKATISAHLTMSEQKFFQDEHSSTVFFLESILSAWHDMVDTLSSTIME